MVIFGLVVVFVVVRSSSCALGFVEVVPGVFLSSRWCLLLGRQVVCVVCGGPGRGAKDADGRRRFTSSAAQPAHPGGERQRELAHHRTTRVQVTCNGLVGPVRSSTLHAMKVYGPCLALSSFEGGLFLFFCVNDVVPSPDK